MSILSMIPPSCDSSSFVSLIPFHENDNTTTCLQTCVLGDGKKMFLKKRNKIPLQNTLKSSDVPISGSLLSKPMSSILLEAEKLQIYQRSQQLKKIDESSDEMLTTNSSSRRKSYINNSNCDDENNDKEINLTSSHHEDSSLWVDRYSPKIFSELLSPEKINRDVLKALKGWDSYVFKTKPLENIKLSSWKHSNSFHSHGNHANNSNKKNYSMNTNKFSSNNMNKNQDNDKNDDNNNNEDEGEEEDGEYKVRKSTNHLNSSIDMDPRPKKKVILLSGNPGTGKTTLAHILARHCGYRPYEVNASDDRSTEKLREILQSCMQSRTLDMSTRNMDGSMRSNESKPNCVILDEIDGVDSRDTIQMLIKIITEPLHVKSSVTNTSNSLEEEENGKNEEENDDDDDDDGNDNDEKENRDKKTKTKTKTKTTSSSSSSSSLKPLDNRIFPLTRPLICICNDLYAPILKELRKHSIIFSFEPPTEMRLVQRLRQICSHESMLRNDNNKTKIYHHSHYPQFGNQQWSTSVLTQLCSAAGNDIRSIINTLQFANSISKVRGYTQSNNNNNNESMSILQSMMQSGLKDISQDIFQLWNMIFCSKDMNIYLSKKSTNIASDVLANINIKYDDSVIISNQVEGGGSYNNHNTNYNYNKSTDRLMEVMDAMYQSCDDYDLAISGCFHNRLSVPYSDPLFHKTAMISDWFVTIDIFQGYYKLTGEGYQLRQYIPTISAVLLQYNSHDARTKMEYPRRDREIFYQSQQRRNILNDFKERSSLTVLGSSCIQVLAVEVVSLLLDILSPKIRSLPYVSLLKSEQKSIQDMVEIMVDYGINITKLQNFQQNRSYSDDSYSSLQLDPPLDKLIESYNHDRHNNSNNQALKIRKEQESFSDMKSRHVLDMIVKENIAFVLKKAIITRAIQQAKEYDQNVAMKSDSMLSYHSNKSIFSYQLEKENMMFEVAPVGTMNISEKKDGEDDSGPVVIIEDVSCDMSLQSKDKSRMDLFFAKKSALSALKRPVNMDTIQSSMHHSISTNKKQRVLFRFNQGFSNAVRRPVTIKDFF